MNAVQPFEHDARLALDLPAELTFEQWEAEGRRLSFTSHALQWYIGDWWNAGERFGDERRADTAKRLFGLEYGTVRNYGSVASKFDVSRRRDKLTFSHHAELAALDDSAKVEELAQKVEEQGLSQRALRAEVQAIRGDNVVPLAKAQHAPPPPPPEPELPPPPKCEYLDALGRYVEAMERLQQFGELTRREADFLAFALEKLGESHAERRPVPDDFEIIFVEQGRIACEPWYRASRITVNRWLLQSGKQRLIDARAKWVKLQRDKAKQPQTEPMDIRAPIVDALLPLATMAANHLRVSRWGGHRITRHQAGGWLVGTVHKTSEQVIDMAVRVGFDREAAKAEAREEGY